MSAPGFLFLPLRRRLKFRHLFFLAIGTSLVGWAWTFALANGPAGDTNASTSQVQKLPAAPPMESNSEKPSTAVVTIKDAEPAKELFSGKVVLLIEALKKRGIKAVDEMKGQVVLETDSGELWPLVADWRGRAFFQDERLRDRKVELIARRHTGIPYLQILMVFTFDDAGVRHYTDYWCDICSIPMYEIKDCDCCQGPIRLRYQKQALPSYIKPQP